MTKSINLNKEDLECRITFTIGEITRIEQWSNYLFERVDGFNYGDSGFHYDVRDKKIDDEITGFLEKLLRRLKE